MKLSALQKARYKYQPKLPPVLLNDLSKVFVELGSATQSMADQGELKKQFPHTYGLPLASITKGKNKAADKVLTIGVILSGGQAPGGHNVIAGLYDGLKKGNKKSRLLGFLGGPSGLVDGKFVEVTDKLMDQYRNTGGFDMIGSGRTKIETEEQFEKVSEVCKKNDIDGVVVIGGDDSNTNAAVLAEYFQSHSSPVKVIGCPKTIDGDLKTEYIETSFGFDTACKTYSELIGNIGRDANSAKKYWHFIKLMGRSASHIALECALQTQPNVCLISEEIEAKKQSLNSIVEYIASVVAKRAENKENFGIALIPEGLIEFVPEMKSLIAQLNDHLAHDAENFAKLKSFEDQKAYILPKLGQAEAEAFQSLPADIAAQLLMDRDPHGNVQVSRIETEKLLILMTAKKLEEWKAAGKFSGSFSALGHFFGYEGRCAFPSNFDADYCYSLGYTAFVLFGAGLTGYISSVRHTNKPAKDWICGGIPITQMMNMEQRHGKQKPVIKKALVELEGKPFKALAAKREEWAEKTSYIYPGAIQYYGPAEVCDQPTKTLELELN